MRVAPFLLVAFVGLLAGCSSGEPGSASTHAPASRTSAAINATRSSAPTPAPTLAPTAPPTPTPRPTVSPSPIPIYHGSPFTVAIEAGHGGPHWFGGSGRGPDGTLMREKDLNLDVAKRLEALLDEAGYNAILIRDGDYTIMPFYSWDYRGSLASETQARVDVANALEADILVSLHFNGSSDAAMGGTQTYYNPDRSFGAESYSLAFFVHDALIRALGETGYRVRDLGIRNDAEVGGDPSNAHSFLLGTNAHFRPSLMPGIISEALFLSNAEDAAAIAGEDARQRMAEAYRQGIDAYFAWLLSPR